MCAWNLKIDISAINDTIGKGISEKQNGANFRYVYTYIVQVVVLASLAPLLVYDVS